MYFLVNASPKLLDIATSNKVHMMKRVAMCSSLLFLEPVSGPNRLQRMSADRKLSLVRKELRNNSSSNGSDE